MSRKPRSLAASLLASGAVLLAAAPAAAWPFGGAPRPADQTAAASSSPASSKTPGGPQTGPQKASPEQRAAAQRLDPLARAAFWQHEAAIDPKDPDAGLGLAVALRQLGRNDEAADSAERVLLFAPKNEDALLESARDHIAAGHGFYSIAPLKEAEALYPKDWRPVSLMAVAMEQDERPDEALAAYDHALKLSPNNPAILSNFALFQAQRGKVAEAEALLRQAVAQPTATAQERQNLALVLGLQGKLAEAEGLMRQDLPPEVADANLAYLKGAYARGGAPIAPTPSAPQPTNAPPRTWGSVQLSDAKGG
jgi:Flp pilus assembly protein TadD